MRTKTHRKALRDFNMALFDLWMAVYQKNIPFFVYVIEEMTKMVRNITEFLSGLEEINDQSTGN